MKEPPEQVIEYLKEGNSKEDLIEWIWSLLDEQEKTNITNGAKEFYNDLDNDNNKDQI